MLTRQTLAHKLGVSTKTVDRLRNQPTFPRPLTIGAALRWREEDVDRWVDSGIRQPERAARRPGRRKSAAELLS